MKYKIGDRFFFSKRYSPITVIRLNILEDTYRCQYTSNVRIDNVIYIIMTQEELDSFTLLKPLCKTILPLP